MDGTYTLVIRVKNTTDIQVGALGDRLFPAGVYTYTGSAFGPGGINRVQHHINSVNGRNDAPHWHIDYLLGTGGVTIEAVHWTPGRDTECVIASQLAQYCEGFGCSDCSCSSHLARFETHDDAIARLTDLHAASIRPQ